MNRKMQMTEVSSSDVKLPNRDGLDIRLVPVSSRSFTKRRKWRKRRCVAYRLTYSDDIVENTMRIGFSPHKRHIVFVDPAGGPFMCVGAYTVEGKTLMKIFRTKHGILLVFGNA